MVLTRIKQLLIELHEKGISELQRHQVSGTCSTTVEVINAYTLPERHEAKEIACEHKGTHSTMLQQTATLQAKAVTTCRPQ